MCVGEWWRAAWMQSCTISPLCPPLSPLLSSGQCSIQGEDMLFLYYTSPRTSRAFTSSPYIILLTQTRQPHLPSPLTASATS